MLGVLGKFAGGVRGRFGEYFRGILWYFWDVLEGTWSYFKEASRGKKLIYVYTHILFPTDSTAVFVFAMRLGAAEEGLQVNVVVLWHYVGQV